MRFLVDAQLPPALARWLSQQGHLAEHVADIGLASAPDATIWRYAEEHGAVLVTKDEDFSTFAEQGDVSPRVVWIRSGNTGRATLLQWFSTALPEVERALARGERLIEVSRARTVDEGDRD